MTIAQIKPTVSTRDRLLNAACQIFVDKGYRDATVADICETAQANIAAVNYHFGNKDNLYRQVWTQVLALYEPLEADRQRLTTPESAEEVFYDFVVDRLEWLVGGDQLERLIHSELVQPTGLVDDLRVEALQKTRQHFLDVIQAVAGGRLSDENVELCCTSVLSQCRAYIMLGDIQHDGSGRYMPRKEEIRSFARHVTTFSVAGTKALAVL